MKKNKSFFKEYQFIILAFMATMGTMIILFLCNSMVPFGDKTVLRMDLYHQYGPLFAELYERVKSGSSLIYSWTSGLGSCFLGNYFNYLSSPIGAVVMFFGHKNITEAIALMILIKASLSASTFTYYLKKSQHNQSYLSVCFGILYAFCGYMLAYYWNIMWLDAMVLLPVVLYGIEKIIDQGKMGTYTAALALTMFSNYYMSFMICIFSCIYFFYYYILSNKKGARLDESLPETKNIFKKLRNSKFFMSGCIFALGSLTAAGIMAVVLLPVYNILSQCSATSGNPPSSVKIYFDIFDFLANHLPSLDTTIRSSGDDVLPNIYCGLLPLILAPLYFFTKSVSKKEKLATLSLLATLYLSFNVNYFNYFWHGMHFPNDLPYRQSFIYSFVLLVMGYKTILRIKEFSSRQIGFTGACLLAFIVIVQKIESKNVTSATIIFTLVLTVLYVLILTVLKDKKFETASVAALLVVCICSEVIMCDTSPLNISVEKTPYVQDYDDFKSLKKKIDTIENNEFYRMELTNLRTRMDNSWYFYNGVSVFSSMAYEKLANLEDDLGMMSNRINSYTYNPQTPVYNLMHGLKYVVNNASVNVLESKYYSRNVESGKFVSYKNNFYLPIAYLVNSEVESWANEEYMDIWKLEDASDPFVLQGDFFSMATGLSSPFKRINVSYINYSNIIPFAEDITATSFRYEKDTPEADGSANFYITIESEGNVYLYFEISGSGEKDITISSEKGTYTHPAEQNCILDLGEFSKGETITVTVPFEKDDGNVTFIPYTMDDEIFNAGYKILNENQMLIEKFDDTYIKGKFVSEKDSLLYTSIPYDEGWKIFIDGKEASKNDIVKIGNALLGVKTKTGIHEIEFKYEVKDFKAGALISIITLFFIALYFLLKKLRKGKIFKSLPNFPEISNYCTEDILLPEKEAILPPSVIKAPEKSKANEYIPPKREIIYPKKSKEVQREIISPETSEEIKE